MAVAGFRQVGGKHDAHAGLSGQGSERLVKRLGGDG
jgi:hypothetical protein